MRKFLIAIFILAAASCGSNEKNTEQTVVAGKSTEDSLKQSISQYPDSLLLKENLIQFYRDSNLYEKAISEARNLIKRDSTNARTWKILGILEYENGDTLEAVRSYEQSVKLSGLPYDIVSLGLLYAETKNKKALEVADYLLANQLQNFEKDANYIKGLFYTYNNQKETAIAYFDKSISLNYTYMDAYREKALALYDLQQYKEAVAVLQRAITIQNNFDDGHFYLGKCYEKLNRNDEAIESYRNVLLYSPDYTAAKEALKRLEK